VELGSFSLANTDIGNYPKTNLFHLKKTEAVWCLQKLEEVG